MVKNILLLILAVLVLGGCAASKPVAWGDWRLLPETPSARDVEANTNVFQKYQQHFERPGHIDFKW